MKWSLLLFFISQVTFAQVLWKKPNGDFQVKKRTFSVASLVRDYAQLKKYHLVMKELPEGEYSLYGPKAIKQKALDLFVSAVLLDAGYTLVEKRELGQLLLINRRDVRFTLNTIHTDIKSVPHNYYHTMFIMKLKHAVVSEVSRQLRPLMSRYGRIIDDKNANSIILSDPGKNIHRLHQLLSSIDNQDFAKNTVKFHQSEEAKSDKIGVKIVDRDQNQVNLFILIFSLIAGIIGFGLRGILIKRS